MFAPLRSLLPKAAARLSPHPSPSHLPPSLRSLLRPLSTSSSPRSTSLLSSLPKRPFSFSPPPKNGSGSRGIASTAVRPSDQVDWTKVATSVGIAAVAVVGLNVALNRETRDALSAAESSYLNSTFRWTGAGLLITALTAKLLHGNGTALRIMQLNPWVAMGGGLVLSIGSMMGVYATDADSPAHYACWALFTATQGLTLSPMYFLNPAILARAGLYTAGALGGLCYVGATAESEKFLYIGGPLMAGLGVLIVGSLAPMLMPRMAVRTMSILENVTAYGGVALFSGFILYDTQKILKHAKLAEMGRMPRDPVRESVSLIIDAINLFVRIVQVLMLQQRKK
ncbi:hypothetical protein RQP46_009866 [Phenoliferia psychrophenolica]